MPLTQWMTSLLLLAVPLGMAAAESTPPRPNIVLIFCDDLGYNDLGCYGSKEHDTPNIDKLADKGTRFTDFYVTAPVCTPSRASLMTGCYPRRVSMHEDANGRWVLFPGARKGLNPDEVTIAELLKQADYATACIGKWHLGDQKRFLPTNQGFDRYFGIPYSNDMGHARANSNYPPLPLLRNETVIEKEPDQSQITRRYTEEAIQFIKTQRDRPFFLYLPHTFPHWPHHASDPFDGKSEGGPFGDTVEEIDWSTGRIMQTLREQGIAKETLVIFTSDNGGPTHHGSSNHPLRGGKGNTWEGGLRVPCIIRWPGHVPASRVCHELTTSMDFYPTLANLAGARIPEDRIIDGKDITHLLLGEPGAQSPHIAFYYYRVKALEAVRSGEWKLRVKSDKPQLFNLRRDIGEQHNVASRHPLIVKRLQALADVARRDLGDGDRKGKSQRPADYVNEAEPLTRGK